MCVQQPRQRRPHDSVVCILQAEVFGVVTNLCSESCDNWLHAECVGIDRRSLPPVYVCAFCAQTPNMRGGRIREARANAQTHIGSSPLAHKSFKSFR